MITYKRGKAKCASDTKVADIYNYYLKNRKSDFDIKQRVFTAILEEYNEHKLNQVIFRNVPFQLPYMGRIEIMKFKPKLKIVDNRVIGSAVDYKKTKELWERNPDAKQAKKLILHLNEESDGYIMKWKWVKSLHLKNKTAYKLQMLRRLKRKLASSLRMTNYKIDFYLDKTMIYNVKN